MASLWKVSIVQWAIIFLVIQGEPSGCVPVAVANFASKDRGVAGAVTMHQLPLLGTFLVGTLRNIICLNSTSASMSPLPANPLVLNNCMIGMTVNNWKSASTQMNTFRVEIKGRPIDFLQSLQTIFNLSNIRLPTIQGIMSGSYNPLPNGLFPLPTPSNSIPAPVAYPFPAMTTEQPITSAHDTNASNGGDLGMVSKSNCSEVGQVYNPRGKVFSSPFGLFTAPGIMGNIPVINGTGTVLMGPLEYMTAGPTSVAGLPLILWQDAIQPVINGTAIQLKTSPNERILDCSVITPIRN